VTFKKRYSESQPASTCKCHFEKFYAHLVDEMTVISKTDKLTPNVTLLRVKHLSDGAGLIDLESILSTFKCYPPSVCMQHFLVQ